MTRSSKVQNLLEQFYCLLYLNDIQHSENTYRSFHENHTNALEDLKKDKMPWNSVVILGVGEIKDSREKRAEDEDATLQF